MTVKDIINFSSYHRFRPSYTIPPWQLNLLNLTSNFSCLAFDHDWLISNRIISGMIVARIFAILRTQSEIILRYLLISQQIKELL